MVQRIIDLELGETSEANPIVFTGGEIEAQGGCDLPKVTPVRIRDRI